MTLREMLVRIINDEEDPNISAIRIIHLFQKNHSLKDAFLEDDPDIKLCLGKTSPEIRSILKEVDENNNIIMQGDIEEILFDSESNVAIRFKHNNEITKMAMTNESLEKTLNRTTEKSINELLEDINIAVKKD